MAECVVGQAAGIAFPALTASARPLIPESCWWSWPAKSRLKILGVLLEDANYSDVIREAQEAVELHSDCATAARISKALRKQRELAAKLIG